MTPVYSASHLLPSALGSFRYLITDMDGVLWRGQEPLPGLVEFVRFLRDRSIKFVCVTNNASTLAEKLAERLQSWGADVGPDEIVTASTATAGLHGTDALLWTNLLRAAANLNPEPVPSLPQPFRERTAGAPGARTEAEISVYL
jgi:hypothetical protein